MDHATDLGEAPVQQQVCRRIRGWPERPFDNPTRLQRNDDQVFGPKLVVGHAARLDDEDARFAIDAAGIAEGQGHEPGPNERLVRSPDLLPQLGQQ